MPSQDHIRRDMMAPFGHALCYKGNVQFGTSQRNKKEAYFVTNGSSPG